MYSIKKKYNDLISPLKRNFLLEGKESKCCIYFGVGVYRIVLKTSTVETGCFNLHSISALQSPISTSFYPSNSKDEVDIAT